MELSRLFKRLDEKGSGSIDYHGFLSLLGHPGSPQGKKAGLKVEVKEDEFDSLVDLIRENS